MKVLAPTTTRRKNWFRGKKPIFQFAGIFLVLMVIFYACTYIPVLNRSVIPSYMRLNASVSATIMSIFGEGAQATGTTVSSARYSVNIRHGCDAVEPTALFVSAVLAFPAAFRTKIPGVVAGSMILALINLLRIITLFYTGIYYPKAFNIMHEDVWQSLFIILALMLWMTWALWATSTQSALQKA